MSEPCPPAPTTRGRAVGACGTALWLLGRHHHLAGVVLGGRVVRNGDGRRVRHECSRLHLPNAVGPEEPEPYRGETACRRPWKDALHVAGREAHAPRRERRHGLPHPRPARPRFAGTARGQGPSAARALRPRTRLRRRRPQWVAGLCQNRYIHPGLRRRELFWVGTTLDDVRAFPEEVRREVGHALHLARSLVYRAVYTVRFMTGVYALHAFQKKSQHGHRDGQARHRHRREAVAGG